MTQPRSEASEAGGQAKGPGLWKRSRERLVRSPLVMDFMARTLVAALRFTRLTSPLAPGAHPLPLDGREPVIIAFWHGQHFMVPLVYPRERGGAAMVSRSRDAQLNAMVLEKFGLETVRGSGGRDERQRAERGGAKALIALKRTLDRGKNVAMVADIPHGIPREAGMGIITLARISGRPILPLAVTTSRRKVLEKSWDKTTINLPFGRSATAVGPFVEVPPDADESLLEAKRRELTDALNAATREAERLADRGRLGRR